MVQTQTVAYPAYTGTEKRKIYIYLPVGYKGDASKRYPVLYAFDGHNLFDDDEATFGKSWGLGSYLDATRTPLIVAAVECNHSPEGGRLSEYSPFDFYNLEGQEEFYKGRGQETFAWILNTFKPMIDRKYRTLRDRNHTFLMGSSMGGLMSLYGVLHYNHHFSRAAALSPTLWAGRKQLNRLAREAKVTRDTVIYMDFGSEEFDVPNTPSNFQNMAAALAARELMLTTRIIPGGMHCEASWEKQLPFVIPTLLYGIDPLS